MLDFVEAGQQPRLGERVAQDPAQVERVEVVALRVHWARRHGYGTELARTDQSCRAEAERELYGDAEAAETARRTRPMWPDGLPGRALFEGCAALGSLLP